MKFEITLVVAADYMYMLASAETLEDSKIQRREDAKTRRLEDSMTKPYIRAVARWILILLDPAAV